MRKLTVLFAAAVLMAASATFARAEEDGGVEVSLSLTYGILLSPDVDDSGGLGITVQGFFGQFMLGEREFDWGAEIGTQKLWDEEFFSARTMPILALARYNMEPMDGGITPYILMGAGFFRTSWEVEIPGVLTMSDSDLDFGISLGLGGRMELSDTMFGDALIRYSRIFDDVADDSASMLNIGVNVGTFF